MMIKRWWLAVAAAVLLIAGAIVMLRAPDDDSAVREALNALSEEGFLEADLDQIGVLQEEPVDEPHASAYQGALEGEVAIIRFDS